MTLELSYVLTAALVMSDATVTLTIPMLYDEYADVPLTYGTRASMFLTTSTVSLVDSANSVTYWPATVTHT